MKIKKIIGVLALLFCVTSTSAQHREIFEIYFDQGSSTIDREFVVNDMMLDRMSDKLSDFVADCTVTIDKIRIDGYTSPEGGARLNENLSERRAEAISDYIESMELSIPDSLIEIHNNGIAWGELRKAVAESETPHKDKVIEIIDEVPVETWVTTLSGSWPTLVDSRNKHLMDLENGIPYQYMMEEVYPGLRKSCVVTLYFKKYAEPVIEDKPEVVIEPKVEPTAAPKTVVGEPAEPTVKPLLAIKTNLLYDLVTAVNLELEVPIGERWSIAGELIFPWWTSCGKASNDWQRNSKRNSLQLLQGNIEGKYWFGDRSGRPVLTGWYLGLYGGMGKYDLERKAEGYQGDFFVMGLSGGYAHTILKRWVPSGDLRMEYSLGVGCMQTDYDKYVEHLGIDEKWHTIRKKSGTQSWLGPTKVKVSLVWMLNRKVNKEN